MLIFNIPPEVCLERNKSRHRLVDEHVIPYHAGLLQRAILDTTHEGWEQIHILGEQDMDVIVDIEDMQSL